MKNDLNDQNEENHRAWWNMNECSTRAFYTGRKFHSSNHTCDQFGSSFCPFWRGQTLERQDGHYLNPARQSGHATRRVPSRRSLQPRSPPSASEAQHPARLPEASLGLVYLTAKSAPPVGGLGGFWGEGCFPSALHVGDSSE